MNILCRLAVVGVFILCCTTPGFAATVLNFDFTVGTNQTGQSSLVFTESGFDNNVSFDAVITVTGFDASGSASTGSIGDSVNINRNSSGIGAGSTGTTGLNQSLRFELTFVNESGGTASLQEFGTLSFSSFSSGEEARVFDGPDGTILATVPGSSSSVNLSPFGSSSFLVFAGPATGSTLRISGLEASVSGSPAVAVPEPASGLLLSLFALGGTVVRWQRTRE